MPLHCYFRRPGGPDGISIGIFKLLGALGERLIGNMTRVCLIAARVPIATHGGRMALLEKNGDAAICENNRGLLVGDHVSKAVTGVIKPAVCGAAPKQL